MLEETVLLNTSNKSGHTWKAQGFNFVCLSVFCVPSAVLVSFLVAMIKYPDKSNVRRKGLFCRTIQRDARGQCIVKSSQQVLEVAGNITSHPRSEKRKMDACSQFTFSCYTVQDPSPGDGAAHNKPQNEDSLRARPCSQVILDRIKLACEITPHQLAGFLLCRCCPCGYLRVRLRVRAGE